jgi:hypothetical protein
MFCDGKCQKGNKKCGLLVEEILENTKTNEIKHETKCVFNGIHASSLRVEGLLNGLHAAENSTRNETAEGLDKIKDVIGTGMIGMIKSVEQRKIDGSSSSD